MPASSSVASAHQGRCRSTGDRRVPDRGPTRRLLADRFRRPPCSWCAGGCPTRRPGALAAHADARRHGHECLRYPRGCCGVKGLKDRAPVTCLTGRPPTAARQRPSPWPRSRRRRTLRRVPPDDDEGPAACAAGPSFRAFGSSQITGSRRSRSRRAGSRRPSPCRASESRSRRSRRSGRAPPSPPPSARPPRCGNAEDRCRPG